MATIRNLRNLILAGIDNNHVDKVCAYIQNERAVAGSRMFPFRFYTAYDILDELKDFGRMTLMEPRKETSKKMDHKDLEATKRSLANKTRLQGQMNTPAIAKFEKALNNAIQVATKRNIPPLKGCTLILCATGYEMKTAKMSRTNMGKACTNVQDVAFLFSVMCAATSEEVTFATFDNISATERALNFHDESLLGLVESLSKRFNGDGAVAGYSCLGGAINTLLLEQIRASTWIDTIIIVHASSGVHEAAGQMQDWLSQYRELINPDLVYADVNICGSTEQQQRDIQNVKNIYLSGFSESIFQILANTSGNGCLAQLVDDIDKKHKLGSPAQQSVLPLDYQSLISAHNTNWKRIKIFISSTFRDMHGERNLLNNYILPELIRRSKTLCIDVVPVDLRWGVASGISAEKQVEACLSEIDRCHLFVGLLGERYGWKPAIQDSIRIKNKLQNKGCDSDLKLGNVSVTEIEMEYGALCRKDTSKSHAFFFLRNRDQLQDMVPEPHLPDFCSENHQDMFKLLELKDRIRTSGFEVMDGYPSTYAGIKDGVPLAGGLESLGTRLLDVLWNAVSQIRENSTKEDHTLNESLFRKQVSFCQATSGDFVGRSKLLHNITDALKIANQGGIIEINGKEGCGATAILSKICFNQMKTSKSGQTLVIPFFAEATSVGKVKLANMLQYLRDTLTTNLGLKSDQEDRIIPASAADANLKSLSKDVSTLLQTASSLTNVANFRMIIFLDGIEALHHGEGHQPLSVEWLPSVLPQGVTIVTSTHSGGKWSRWLSMRSDKIKTIHVEPMDLSDRRAMAIQFLKVFGKTLKEEAFDNQLSTLISKREAGNAAYLKMLCIEITRYGVFEQVSSQIKNLGESLDGLLTNILKRVEEEVGSKFVANTVLLLVTSGDLGLTETRLCSIMSEEFMPDEFDANVSMSLSLLLNGLEPFLQPTLGSHLEGIILLKRGKCLDVLHAKYCSSTQAVTETHKLLANFYNEEYQCSSIMDPIVLEALTLHFAATASIKQLEETICSLRFVQHSACSSRTLTNLQFHLAGNYFTARTAKDRFLTSPKVKAYTRFIQKHKDLILGQPCLIIQTALNEGKGSVMALEAAKILTTGSDLSIPKYLMLTGNEQDSPLIATRHSSPLEVTAFALEACDSIEGDNLLAAQGMDDGSIVLSLAMSALDLFTLLGHSAPITALEFLSGSKSSGDTFLASGSADGELCFWDLNTRIRLKTFKAHNRRLSGLSSSHDGLTLVSVGWDGACKVWSGRGHREISALKQSVCPYNCVVFHPEKDYIVTGDWKGLVKVWDLTNLERKAILRGHEAPIQDVKLTSDATRVISVDIRGMVCIFDGKS
jgi:telomerase protein component 1